MSGHLITGTVARESGGIFFLRFAPDNGVVTTANITPLYALELPQGIITRPWRETAPTAPPKCVMRHKHNAPRA